MKTDLNRTNNRSLNLSGYFGAIFLLLVPFLLGAGNEERATTEQNRQKIQEMTAQAHKKLKRNFAEYQKLSKAEQDVYRKLHQRLEEDTKNGGKLRDVMWVYEEWLKTLSPWQREELLKEKNPAARLKLVQKFKERQKHEEWVETLTFTEKRKLRGVTGGAREKLIREFKRDQETRPSRSSIGFSRWHRPQIPSEQFGKIMELVESHTKIPEEDQDRFSSITIVERHLLVLLAALKQSRNGLPPAPDRQQNREGPNVSPVPWPDDLLMGKIIEVISDSDFQERYQSYGGDKEYCRRFLFFRIYFSFSSEWRDDHEPSEKEMHEFFKELDQSEKDRILRQSSSAQRRKLMYLYFAKRESGSKFHDQYTQLRELMMPYFRAPRGGGRPSFSRDGQGRSDKGRFKGRRRGEFVPGKGPRFGDPKKRDRKSPGGA